MSKLYTLGALLEELKEQTPKLETGTFFETLKSIYPTDKIINEDKHYIFEGRKLTIPLSCSQKSKRQFEKDNSPFLEFSKDNTRGDFLEVIETDGYTAKCINRSITEEIQKKYYNKDEIRYISISLHDIFDGTIKRVYRGISKYI